MSDSSSRNEPKFAAAAERKMQAWAKTAEIHDRSISLGEHLRIDRPIEAFLTLSRETGAGGSEIGERLGQIMGWKVFDKNILDHIAERLRCCRQMLDLVDETSSNWVYDVLGTWMDRKVVPHETFVSQLTRVVHTAAKGGRVIFVGRGAQFLLPREKTFSVRIVAPESHRIARIRQLTGMTENEAFRFVRATDAGRREFVQRFFHHDVNDPHLYDMTVNSHQLGIQAAAEAIASAVSQSPKMAMV